MKTYIDSIKKGKTVAKEKGETEQRGADRGSFVNWLLKMGKY